MTYQYPKGYWSSVFDQAAFLMNQRGSLSGETAYWLARRIIDRGLAQNGQGGVVSNLALSQTLVLSP